MLKPWLWCAALVGVTSLVSMTAVAKTASTRPAESFRVVGTEPFWNMTIDKNGIVYKTPDSKGRSFPYVAPLAAQGREAEYVRVYRLQGNNMLVLKRVNNCSDTMSDKIYPYSATLVLGNTVREGCAEAK
jgi:uncharacterized membrane protein